MNRLLLFACCAISVACMPLFAQNNMPVLAQFQGEHNASNYGFTLESLDFNHDSYDDLVVFSFSYGYQWNQTPSRGKVYIYYGGPNFSSTTPASLTVEGDFPNGERRRIEFVQNCGDVNGDGFDDLLIIYEYHDVFRKYSLEFYYGQSEDMLTPDLVLVSQDYDIRYDFVELGDVDGDGYDDIGYVPASTSYWLNILWGGSFQSQTVHIVPSNGVPCAFVSAVGDINNDGYADFSIGYMFDIHPNPEYVIKLYYGNPSREFAEPDTLVFTYTAITLVTKPLGDINGDGYDDFFGYADQNLVRIWYGGETIDVHNPDLLVTPPLFGDVSACGIAGGDVNNDGFSDLIGASYAQERFAVWLGNAVVETDYDFRVINNYDNFGYDVAMGDFNGDGYCDIATSAPREYSEYPLHDYRGYVFVYGGNAGMVANEDELAPQLADEWQFSTFPNPLPVGKAVTLCYQGKGYEQLNTKTISLYNLKGQRVYKTQDSSRGETSNIQLPELTSGVYIMDVSANGQHLNSKRIVVY